MCDAEAAGLALEADGKPLPLGGRGPGPSPPDPGHGGHRAGGRQGDERVEGLVPPGVEPARAGQPPLLKEQFCVHQPREVALQRHVVEHDAGEGMYGRGSGCRLAFL